VPIHEIARRAGVGTGTVSRHFPTKEDLYIAIVRDRIERVVEQGRDLAAAQDPGTAFFEFFSTTVDEFAANLGLADALAGAGFDMHSVASGAKFDVMAILRDLLAGAQKAGAVRKGIELDDVKALMVACCRGPQSADAGARRRMVEVISQGLRPQTSRPTRP
jgi:AcrR family transcriptional regulator